jgi:tripartite-type tricarboxylate transporter receptor subunit TctC
MTSMHDAMPQRRRRVLQLGVALAATPWAGFALARYPERAVRLIVPGGAGGATDAVARIPQNEAERALGQPLVVDNRIGAGGAIGTMEAVRSPADGYTLLVTSLGTHVLRPLLEKSNPYETLRDLAPISRLVDVPGIILATPGLPVSNLHELIAFAKASPRPLAYGTPGIGTSAHLIAELLCARADIELLHVPYSSSAPSYADLIAGRLSLAFSLVTGVQGHVVSGRMKAIAVTSRTRVRSLPKVPTVEESGLANFNVTSWYGLMAPAGTPLAARARVHRAFATALAVDDVVDRLAGIGADVVANTPAQFADDLRDDFARWAAVIRKADIHL